MLAHTAQWPPYISYQSFYTLETWSQWPILIMCLWRCYTYDELGNIWWHLPPGYNNLEGDNGDGPPPAKRPWYFDTHMINPLPKFNCAYAALDTSTACYSSAPAGQSGATSEKIHWNKFSMQHPEAKEARNSKSIPKTWHASHKGSTIRSWH